MQLLSCMRASKDGADGKRRHPSRRAPKKIDSRSSQPVKDPRLITPSNVKTKHLRCKHCLLPEHMEHLACELSW